MSSWTDILAVEKKQDYFKQTIQYVASRREEGVTVYPPQEDVFNAFKATPFDQIKVVILGQDP